MKFECPNCHNNFKLGKCRASWQCPKCRITLVIQDTWRRAGKIVGNYEMSKYFRIYWPEFRKMKTN